MAYRRTKLENTNNWKITKIYLFNAWDTARQTFLAFYNWNIYDKNPV